ncbi:hypothetical protein VKT23_013284 [Stygiomarasmius scandens]|uniref:F-box domain-containing protein n=1 Tax=Marasmiellus scandens TaxID=2682957 RepID=A0ABR1J4Q0_9AGAR
MTAETLYPFNLNLLTTNAVPDDNDVHRVRKICVEYSQDLDRMNAQIERLQASIDAITLKRDALQSRLSSLQSITSPLRTLPLEVLQTIFINCLEPFPILSAHEAPMLLTRICSKWRSTAIGTPELWASIHVALVEAKHPFESYGSTCNSIREGLRTFLLRSGSLPLNISLCSEFPTGPGTLCWEDIVDEINQTLEILLPHHKRWKYLKLQVPLLCVTSVERLRGEDLLNLETVSIICFKDECITPPPPTRPFFENAPRLQRLSLGSQTPSTMLRFIGSVDWARLTHLVFCFGYWETPSMMTPLPSKHVIDMLKLCVNLEECAISLPGTANLGTSPWTNLTITLPKLKKFAIACYYPSQIMSFLLDLFVTPGLRELALDGTARSPSNRNVWMFSSIIDFIQRSSCSLRSFEFTAAEGPNKLSFLSGPRAVELMVALLKLMPELKNLDLSQFPLMTEALLEAFSAISPDSGEVLCPKLTRIEFEDSPSLTEDTLIHFLSTRVSQAPASSTVPLDCVVIKNARPSSESFLAQFGDAVQYSTPWSVGAHINQHFGRPNSRVPERVFGF